MTTFFSKPETGYFVVKAFDGPLTSELQHVFCGRSGDDVSDCPNCRTPLLQLMRLDTADERIQCVGLSARYIPLLFCWKCNVSQEPFFYSVTPEGVLIVRNGRGGVETDFPYDNYPTSFPANPVQLVALSTDQQQAIKGINSGEVLEIDMELIPSDIRRPRHQVGGEPYLVQRELDLLLKCVECEQPMPFFATVADDNTDSRGFTGNPFVQVLYYLCRRCSVVCAIQRAD